jgi:lambda family phage portal protein
MNIRRKIANLIDPDRQAKRRSFAAAMSHRVSRFNLSWGTINADISNDMKAVVMRSRQLAKNNDNVTSFLNLMQRNIIGESGFRLQCRAKGEDGAAINQQIENLWAEYNSAIGGHVTLDGMQSGREFDILILRTLLVDGECFIRVIDDHSNRFGKRYEVIDTLNVDCDYNEYDLPNGEFIRCGIRLDRYWKPISYFVRDNKLDMTYSSGERIEYPAAEIIHLYRKYFPRQVRGITPLAAAVQAVNQLESYKEAELVAARMHACNMGFYVKTAGAAGDFFDENQIDKEGDWTSQMSPGQIAFAPDGYDVKQLNNSHPAGNFGGFIKAICRGIFASLGISYNKGASDYESVNYSSLREAALEDREAWRDLQAFLIENWKDRQFINFIRGALLAGTGNLKAVLFDEYMKHKFFGRSWDWVDPAKDISAISSSIALGLTDHITEIEKRGGDVDEILDRESLYLAKRRERGLPETFGDNVTTQVIAMSDSNTNENNNEEDVTNA